MPVQEGRSAETPPDRQSPEEPSQNPEPVAPPPDNPALSEEALEKKSKSIVEEFLHIDDYKEAVECVEELDSASQLSVFVRVAIESTLERDAGARQRVGQLLLQLLQRGVLPKDQFCRGSVSPAAPSSPIFDPESSL